MKVTRTGVDHAWGNAISRTAKNSFGTLLSPRLPCGSKRPPLEKRVRSKGTKKIIKRLQAKVVENHAEFMKGETVNNLGRPPRPLHPGRRQPKSAKSKELECQLFEKAKSKLSASSLKQPKVIKANQIEANQIEANKIDSHVSNGKITVWVPAGMEPYRDMSMHWEKVNAMTNADTILCKAGIQKASLNTILCAKHVSAACC